MVFTTVIHDKFDKEAPKLFTANLGSAPLSDSLMSSRLESQQYWEKKNPLWKLEYVYDLETNIKYISCNSL